MVISKNIVSLAMMAVLTLGAGCTVFDGSSGAKSYSWEEGISFDYPEGKHVVRVSDNQLLINNTGEIPDGDLPQSKMKLIHSLTVEQLVAEYSEQDEFAQSELEIGERSVTKVTFTDGFAAPTTLYIVDLGETLLEYDVKQGEEAMANEIIESLSVSE